MCMLTFVRTSDTDWILYVLAVQHLQIRKNSSIHHCISYVDVSECRQNDNKTVEVDVKRKVSKLSMCGQITHIISFI